MLSFYQQPQIITFLLFSQHLFQLFGTNLQKSVIMVSQRKEV
nr:MAG TPA: hypothetical protein [Bacteriophage sp.]